MRANEVANAMRLAKVSRAKRGHKLGAYAALKSPKLAAEQLQLPFTLGADHVRDAVRRQRELDERFAQRMKDIQRLED